MGDFVKGPLDDRYPSEITRGLLLHRRIDTYTDAHPIVVMSRGRIGAQRRRFAGILVDMFYDHFLALHWTRFAHVPLEEFTARVYTVLREHRDLLPERLQRIAPYMAQGDWLGSYREVAAVETALDRMGQRLKRGNALLGSGQELREHYAGLESDFLTFFPDVVGFAAAQHKA
jgi:acyl carrier protein phosphodiesterase